MEIALIWILVGFVLIVAEFVLTRFIVVFFGLAALCVGLLLWAGMTDAYGLPYLMFAALSLGSVLLLRSRFQEWFVGTTISADVDDDFIGHEVRIASGFDAASPGRGKVDYRGASWDSKSASALLPPGSIARISDRKGSLLEIEPVTD
ncbi:MAG: NfeD family protein [Pseudomonadales bacterium]|nr:NfeD family protein [Pseudomonadales bacterium]